MDTGRTPKFELPRKLEKIFAALALYYKEHGKEVLLQILVNSRYHVEEEWSYDNWNAGTYGHAIYFQVPSIIYKKVIDDITRIAQQLCNDINRISNVENEHIARVILEIQDEPLLESWREKSGALLTSTRSSVIASQDELLRLWKPNYLRLFLSHKAEYKREASMLKDAMEYFGVSCFVAHEDIEPTKEWQDEIEKALFTMDALVALMTENFSNSYWTDQEIGVAIGREVPVIPIRLGTDPYGFIGKFQALSGTGKEIRALAKEVYELLWSKPVLGARLIESLVERFEQ